MEILVVLLSVVVLGLIYVVYTTNLRSKSSSTNELIQFSNSLSSQIQEIRKEIDSNSKESRKEFDLKLSDINKQINDFHKTSSSNITQQFKESNKVIKDVTSREWKTLGLVFVNKCPLVRYPSISFTTLYLKDIVCVVQESVV